MGTDEQDQWISAREAADMLGVSDSTVYNLARAGELVVLPIGVRHKRISRQSVLDYIARRVLTAAPRTTPRRGRKRGAL